MTRFGTSYFPSIGAAFLYFREYGYSKKDVREMIETKTIHIGKPIAKRNEKVILVHEKPGRRYHIEIGGGSK